MAVVKGFVIRQEVRVSSASLLQLQQLLFYIV